MYMYIYMYTCTLFQLVMNCCLLTKNFILDYNVYTTKPGAYNIHNHISYRLLRINFSCVQCTQYMYLTFMQHCSLDIDLKLISSFSPLHIASFKSPEEKGPGTHSAHMHSGTPYTQNFLSGKKYSLPALIHEILSR